MKIIPGMIDGGMDLVGELEAVLERYKTKKLLGVCRGDPDPDFLGAAAGFNLIAGQFGISPSYMSTEPVGCEQNEKEIDWLGIKVRLYKEGMDFHRYDGFFVLDAHGIDRRLLRPLSDLSFVALIDHHDPQLNGKSPEFVDIRHDVGSTCTIISSYMEEKGLLNQSNESHRMIATALMYGIRVDTNGMKRAYSADDRANAYLRTFVDPNALNQLFFQRMTIKDMDIQNRAWKNRCVLDHFMISGVGYIPLKNKTALAIAADKFTELQDINTILIYGVIGDMVQGSLRTCDPQVRPRDFLESMFPLIHEWGGSCGGHGTGGFSIPIEGIAGGEENQDIVWARVKTFMDTQFFQVLGKPVPTQPSPRRKILQVRER